MLVPYRMSAGMICCLFRFCEYGRPKKAKVANAEAQTGPLWSGRRVGASARLRNQIAISLLDRGSEGAVSG